MKWLQYQILRNCLQTNVIVSHFIHNVNPACQYCKNSDEVISHLFWLCPIVSEFLKNIFVLICNTGLAFNPIREQFLFGYVDQAFSSPSNYLVLILKKYIWSNKFKEIKNLLIFRLKIYLGYTLSDLQLIYDLKNKSAAFNVWNDLLVLVPEADTNKQADHGHLLPPPRVQHLLVPAGQARDPHAHLPQAQLIPPDQENAGCGV